jgi:hypoxanthine phosphoribosyltransferase
MKTMKAAFSQQLSDEIEAILISEEQIQSRVRELGTQIACDYEASLGEALIKSPLIAIGLLRGAVTFLADLTRATPIPLEYDFLQLSSYGQSHEAGQLKLVHDLTRSVTGRHLLIVEDIVDTGQTLNFLQQELMRRTPASVKFCALIDKTPRRQRTITLDYFGFRIESDAFVVGYGLDYAERYRNLPYVAALKQDALKKQSHVHLGH